MADQVDENAVPLSDLPLADRRALRHDHPLLNAYAAQVNKANGLPEHFLSALKDAGERSESVGKNSVSPRGATGVMQFMEPTAKQYGLVDRTDPMASIDAAGRMGADLMKRLKTNDPAVLAAAYNSGPNRQELRDGKIPNIPETQAYAKNVSDYIAKQPKAQAAAVPKENNTVPFSDLPPEDQARENDRIHSATNPNYYSPAGSGLENFAAGAGKTVSDTGKMLGQMGAAPINAVSRMISGKNIISPSATSTNESNALDTALMHTGAGTAGNLAGDLAITALPFGALTKMGLVKGAANLASKIPAVGGALSAMLPTTVAGGLMGAAQPTQDEEGFGKRMLNAGVGAAMGPLTYGLGAAGKALGKTELGQAAGDTLKSALGKTGNLASKFSDYIGATQPSIAKDLTPTGEAAVKAAFDNGVHVYPQQIRAPGTALNPAQHAEQAKSFTRAVLKNDLNQDTSDLNKALQGADKQSGIDYGKVYKGETIPIHESMPALKAMQSETHGNFDPRYKSLRSDEANDLLNRAIDSVQSKPTLTGEEMQQALSMYKGKVRDYQKGDRNGFIDRSAIDTIHGITDSLTNASNKVLSPEKQDLLKAANGRYRRMLELEPTLQNNALGTLSPTDYASVIQKKYPMEFSRGRNDQKRSDLARYGSTFMTPNAAQEAKLSPTDMLIKSHVIAPLIGGVLGGTSDSDHTGLGRTGNIGGGAAAGLALSLLAGHATPSTSRAIASELGRKNGALAAMFNNRNAANSAANVVNSQAATEDGQRQINTGR